MTTKIYIVDSFDSACKYISEVRHTVLAGWLAKEKIVCSLSSVVTPIITEEQDKEEIKLSVAHKLKNCKSPCVRRAYNLD